MNSIGIECACEKPQDDTPPVQHITTVVDVEITRHRLKALIKRLKEWEADLAPNDVLYNDIDGLFDENGDLKYFKEPVWTDEDLSREFHIPTPQVKWFLEQAYPNFCYEERASHERYNMYNALSRLCYAYQAQKLQFAELKDSYDALKAHANDVKADPLNDEDCPKCKKLRNELIAEQIQKANAMLRAFRLEQKVNELSEELKEAKIELEDAETVGVWENILLSCLIATLGLSIIASVISLIFS
jgi:hypothetical protein